MGWFSNQEATYKQYKGTHESKLSHEMMAGAAAYEATKAYEDHVAANGKPDSHAKAKEVLAGFVGAFVDREFETKGLDYLDRQEAKEQAVQCVSDRPAEEFGY